MEFNYGECNCVTPCSELYYRKTVYYTEMHNNFRQKTANLLKRFPDIALASVRISLPESHEYQVSNGILTISRRTNILAVKNFAHNCGDIFNTNFLHQFLTPIFYTNFLHQFLHQFYTPVFTTIFIKGNLDTDLDFAQTFDFGILLI